MFRRPSAGVICLLVAVLAGCGVTGTGGTGGTGAGRRFGDHNGSFDGLIPGLAAGRWPLRADVVVHHQ